MSNEVVFLKSRTTGKVIQRSLKQWNEAEANENGNPYKKGLWYKITPEEAGLKPAYKEASAETVQEAKEDLESLSKDEN